MKIPFRYKVSIIITLGVLIIYIILSISFLLSSYRQLKEEFYNNAEIFARITYDKFADMYIRYYRSLYFKFREFIITHINLTQDLKRLFIISVDGEILFDSDFLEIEMPVNKQTRYIDDEFVMENLRSLELKTFKNGEVKIIYPYIDGFGVHRFSTVYYFSYDRLKREIGNIIKISSFILFIILILSALISIFLSHLITSHLSILDNAAKEIARGNFSKVIKIRTNDEFQELADTFNSMSERIRVNIKDLKNLIGELKERDKQKTHFIASISHELRTPLTASLGYVDYLLKNKLGELNEKQKRSLEIIKRNLERLNNDIHSLLQISQYHLEGVKIETQKTNIEKIIKNTLQDLSPHIENKNIKIEISLQVKDCMVDKEKIKNVFENILINATKFTPENGFIKINNSTLKEDGQVFILFDFYNNSDKIPEKKLNMIFEPFYQIDVEISKKFGGMGLGLSICKNIIEAHNGKIWAKNDRNGFHILFKLPGGIFEEEKNTCN